MCLECLFMYGKLYRIGFLTILVALLISTSTVYSLLYVDSKKSNIEVTARVDFAEGTNHYKLIEIDNGDNNEEQVVTYIRHEFVFSAQGDVDVVEWEFGDGTYGNGLITSHQYELPGHYIVKATMSTEYGIDITELLITVHLKGVVEADNMECTCAPTAKDTLIDLQATQLPVIMEGSVSVEHDGSSEPCSLRFPFQDCHLRATLQWTQDDLVVHEEIIFDDTFRINELTINYTIDWTFYEEGDGIQILLETDQLRDWHKPSAEWYSTVI